MTCKTVANMIKGKTPEEIRKTFNIKNDFTEEEEAQVFSLFFLLLFLTFEEGTIRASVLSDDAFHCLVLCLFQVRKENQWCEEK